MGEKLRVMFFDNGGTGVFKNGEQVPELQHSWLLKFVEFLTANGIDPEECELLLPSGRRAKIFKTENGYNWRL